MSTTKRKMKRLRERAMLLRIASPPPRIEICASFARKFNLSNYDGPAYESIDFFVSRKLDCEIDQAPMVVESLRALCIEDVETGARDYLREAKKAGWKAQAVAATNARAFEARQRQLSSQEEF